MLNRSCSGSAGFLLEKALRTSDGAISHLMGEAQIMGTSFLLVFFPFPVLSPAHDADDLVPQSDAIHDPLHTTASYSKMPRSWLRRTTRSSCTPPTSSIRARIIYGGIYCLGRGLMMRATGELPLFSFFGALSEVDWLYFFG